MSVAKESGLQQHLTILGWLYLVGHALFLVVGLFLFVLLTGIGLSVPDPQARTVLLLVGPSVGLLLVILALRGSRPATACSPVGPGQGCWRSLSASSGC